jgi:hypothetical protein
MIVSYNYRGILDAESVCSAAVAFGRFAALVLPVVFEEEWNIHAPDDDRSTPLHSFGGIDGIPPHDIPSRMIVVRLNCPGASAAL